MRSLDFTALKRRRREALEKALQLGEVAIEPERNTLSAVSKNPYMPILICAPSSVVTNWVTDFRYVYSFRKRRDYFLAAIIMLILLFYYHSTWGHFAVFEFCKENDYSIEPIITGLAEVLLISHSQLASETHFPKLKEVPWKMCIIDEFHIFKGVKSRWAKNTRKLRGEHGTRILGRIGSS